jgi:predicted alpha/beta-hydrolase family hydrolase
MIDVARRWRNRGPIVLAGKSMGGRMASMLLAEGRAPEAVGAVYLGYPLHPPGKPEKLRADHLPDVPVPQLFLSGTKDPLCDLRRLRPVLRRVGPSARLFVVDRGDHSLAVSRKEPMLGSEAWLSEVARFVLGRSGAP